MDKDVQNDLNTWEEKVSHWVFFIDTYLMIHNMLKSEKTWKDLCTREKVCSFPKRAVISNQGRGITPLNHNIYRVQKKSTPRMNMHLWIHYGTT